MKKKRSAIKKKKSQKSLFSKTWRRGKIDRGTIFIVVIIVTLMFVGYAFVGGIPTTITTPRDDNIMAIEINDQYPQEQGLQMHTFQGVTVTPYPTLAPPVAPPATLPVSEVSCGQSVSGTLKPELIWAYRISSTPASGNAQSVQIFFSGPDALALGTTEMTQKPTQHITNPPVNPNNKDTNGFPISPALFLTDITTNAGDTSGDAQSGGVAQFPKDVYGAWRTENGLSSTTPNGQNLGTGADLWPAANGPAGGGPRTSTWTAQLIWPISSLKTKTGAALTAGNTYRAQFELHEGTQNKELAVMCFTFKL